MYGVELPMALSNCSECEFLVSSLLRMLLCLRAGARLPGLASLPDFPAERDEGRSRIKTSDAYTLPSLRDILRSTRLRPLRPRDPLLSPARRSPRLTPRRNLSTRRTRQSIIGDRSRANRKRNLRPAKRYSRCLNVKRGLIGKEKEMGIAAKGVHITCRMPK